MTTKTMAAATTMMIIVWNISWHAVKWIETKRTNHNDDDKICNSIFYSTMNGMKNVCSPCDCVWRNEYYEPKRTRTRKSNRNIHPIHHSFIVKSTKTHPQSTYSYINNSSSEVFFHHFFFLTLSLSLLLLHLLRLLWFYYFLSFSADVSSLFSFSLFFVNFIFHLEMNAH